MKAKRLKKKLLKGIEYREGSENIFADIGISDPEEALAKARVAMKIRDVVEKKKSGKVQNF